MPTMTQINDADLAFFNRLAAMTSDRHVTEQAPPPKLNMGLEQAVCEVFFDLLKNDPSAYAGFELDCSPTRVAVFVVEDGFDAETGQPLKIFTSVMDGATPDNSEGIMTLDDTEGLIDHIIETHHVDVINVDKIVGTALALGIIVGGILVLGTQLIAPML